jgi:hypothetical protein
LESFFRYDNIPYHELNIIHHVEAENFDCPKGFYTFDSESIRDIDIRPAIIRDIIFKKAKNKHIIQRDN